MTKYGIRKVANHWQAFIHALVADATSPTEVWACAHEHPRWEDAVLCGGAQLAKTRSEKEENGMITLRIRPRQFEMEAVQLTAENRAEVAKWVAAEVEEDGDLVILTWNRHKVWAQPGDWIIRGTIGEFFVRSDDAFHEQYEPIHHTPTTHRCGTCRRYVVLSPEHRGRRSTGRCPECGVVEAQLMPVEGIGS